MTNKAKADLHYRLTNLLTNCETDQEFCERLLYARQIIDRCLKDFTEEEIDEYGGIYEE